MVAKFQYLMEKVIHATIMTYGYNPKIGTWSPFTWAYYAVVESVLQSCMLLGGDYRII